MRVLATRRLSTPTLASAIEDTDARLGRDIAIDRHTPQNNPAEALSALLPGLASVGRRRDDKPPCCDDPAGPPDMGDELRTLLESLL